MSVTVDVDAGGSVTVDVDENAGGPAGGVLSGNYPDPGFAVPMATEAELTAHEAAHPAHPASGVSVASGAGVTATDVQAAIAQIVGFITSQEAGDSAAIAAVAAALADETTRATAQELLKLAKSANLSDVADAAAARTNLGLGSAATHPATDFDVAGAAAAAQAASQPLDSDLTAIAALSTTTFGRALLALADAAAGRTALGLGSAATQSSSAFDPAGAATAAAAALVNSSPATLDTLKELADALGDDPNFATTIATALGTKVDTAGVGLVKTGTTMRRAASTTGYANLAALPTASAHTGEQIRTTDGGIYESDGASWLVIRDPTGTYALRTPTVPGDLVIGNYTPYRPPSYDAAYRGTTYRSTLGGGHGAVVGIRYDDIPSSDSTSILPLHTARGLPASFGAVSGFIGLGGRCTAAQLAAMRDAGMEIACHTHSHDTNPTLTDAYWVQETSGAVAEIRAALRGVANSQGFNLDGYIENFIQPGTWLNEPGDLARPSDLETTYAHWLMNHFAASEGYIREMQMFNIGKTGGLTDGAKMLPAPYKYGSNHVTVVPTTAVPPAFADILAYTKALIDQVVKYGGYLELVCHSASLDTAGSMTTTQWTAVLDYIKAYRDNDQIDVMTPTAALHAQPASVIWNLLADPTWNDSAAALNPSWNASGAPVVQVGAGHSGGNAIDVDSANWVGQSFQIGQLTEAGARTLHLSGWYKNAVPGSARTPRFTLRFDDNGSPAAVWVSTDKTTLAANDAWTRFDILARAPRFPDGSATSPIYCRVNILANGAAGNKVRVSDLMLRKV